MSFSWRHQGPATAIGAALLALSTLSLAHDDSEASWRTACEGLDAVSRETCEVVVQFEEMAFEQRRPREAMERFAAEHFVDHNPNIRGDLASAIAHLARLDWSTAAPERKIVHFVVRGDTAMIHHHLIRKPGERGIAAVDIFRVENGKLVEHWDVLQPIPEESVNPSPMF